MRRPGVSHTPAGALLASLPRRVTPGAAGFMADWIVHNVDCLDFLRTLPSGSVDAVVTDPPYAVSVAGAAHVSKPGKGTRSLDFFAGDTDWAAMTETVLSAARECMRVLSDAGSMYWWVGHRQFGPLITLFESAGFSTRFLVWAKECPPPPPPWSGWPSGAELCIYAYRTGRVWNLSPADAPRSNVITADSFRHGQPGKVDHPTQKPLAVIEPLLHASTDAGATVLDPFCGSGTTGVACVQTGRNFIGCEIDPKYAAIARRRIADAVPLWDAAPKPKEVQQTLC